MWVTNNIQTRVNTSGLDTKTSWIGTHNSIRNNQGVMGKVSIRHMEGNI